MYYLKNLDYLFIILIFFVCHGLLAQESDCANGIDDDNDGFIDCGDTDCIGNSDCANAFICTNTLYQVISNSLKRLDPISGEYEQVGDASANYNGAGYNVQDGYLYGIGSGSDGKHLWKIDNSGSEEDLGLITRFAGRSYVGDFDELGNLYTYQSGSAAFLSYIDVDAEEIESVQVPITSLSGSTPSSADITYNPIFKKFYGLDGQNRLFSLDPVEAESEILGHFGAEIDVRGSYGAAWSDVEGSSYFANNNTGKIFKFVFDQDGAVSSVTHVSTGQPTNSNDGVGCFFSLPPFETSCDDGIDNDGDGYTDCEDPDCANTGSCPRVDISLRSIEVAGPNSIVPVHITFVNNSSVDATGFSFDFQMPTGFSYIGDTLETLGSATIDTTLYPEENNRSTLSWGVLNLPVGDTIVLSMSILADPIIEGGSYNFQAFCSGILSQPIAITHVLTIDESVFYNPEPYNCEPAFYQVYKKRGKPNVFGKLDPTAATYEEVAIIDPQANGLGFDVNTGFAYGSDGKKFIRIDQLGYVSYLNLDFDKKVYVGDVDTLGRWFGKVGSDLVVVDLSTYQIIENRAGEGMPGWDMAYNKDGNFYAVHKDKLYVHNSNTKISSEVGTLAGDDIPKSGHGAQWTGSDGYHYISNNATGKIYRIDVTSMKATLCMTAEAGLQFNDGFACPTELVPVFSFDYGDLQIFPVARQLVFEQDLGDDGVPDYNMAWLGKHVTHELLDPSNANASGDTAEDGIVAPSIVVADEDLQLDLIISSNTENYNAFWGVWIDWNMDGAYESFERGTQLVSEEEVVSVLTRVPIDYVGETYAVRARVSSAIIEEQSFAGDILEPGEVEDYIFSSSSTEICSNGIDDNGDGLLDCDDPGCVDECDYNETTTGEEGGLESNGDLIKKIAKTMYKRKKLSPSNYSKSILPRFTRTKDKVKTNNMTLESIIPHDAISGTESYVSSPAHLIDITNASDLFAVDIYESDKRVAVALLLETEGQVYEHTKYVCDRLSGSSIEDIYQYNIDGLNNFSIVKIKTVEGKVEYSTSFGLRPTDTGELILESHWGLSDYPSNTIYTNVQLWANSTNYLLELYLDIISRVQSYHDIVQYNIGSIPKFYIKSGLIEGDSLKLSISNPLRLENISATGYISYSETSQQEEYLYQITLSGQEEEELSLPTNYAYYIGLSFLHEEITTPDMIFAAEGAWGYNLDNTKEEVNNFIINPGGASSGNRYNINRSINMTGFVTDYISIYRSFTPRFEGINLDEFEALTFSGSGNVTIEVVAVSSGISEWQDQARYVIELGEEDKQYVLGKEFFKNAQGLPNSWEDLNMIVINVLGDNQSSRPFDLSLKEFAFGWSEQEAPYIVSTDSGIIGPLSADHVACTSDGTDMGSLEVKASTREFATSIHVENKNTDVLYVEDVYVMSDNGDMAVALFEPQVLEEGETYSFDFFYKPREWPSENTVDVSLYITSDMSSEVVDFQLKARARCIVDDHVLSEDVDIGDNHIKAQATITTDANVDADENISFIAGQSLELHEGFELSKGSSAILIIDNQCEE